MQSEIHCLLGIRNFRPFELSGGFILLGFEQGRLAAGLFEIEGLILVLADLHLAKRQSPK